MNAIETRNLRKYYGKSRGIDDISLAVAEGDVFGFIGPNGAGKSTTIRILLGLITNYSGEAELFSRDVRKEGDALRADIGYMPSEAMFYGNMRVSEVISFSARLRKKDCDTEARRLCERFEIDTSKRIDELSFGNRRKVSLVCAAQHDPRLYILDEPTGGLDPIMQREFFSLLREKNRAGATIFLSSHVLSEVGRHCRTAGVVKNGRIVALQPVEKLAANGAKRVTLHTPDTLPELEGAEGVEKDNGHISFLYSGEIGRLLAALSGMRLSDVTIAEPDVEEIFMHYYGDENGKS